MMHYLLVLKCLTLMFHQFNDISTCHCTNAALGKPHAIIPAEGDATEFAQSTAEDNQNKKKGMVLPFEPHSITFDNIKYSVDMPQEMKDQGVVEDKLLLLKGVSGAFRLGVLNALMGVSGAGKTTLMDVLVGRKTGG